MQIRILFFGLLQDLFGHSTELIDLPEGACLHDVLSHYVRRTPRLEKLLPSLALSVNQEYATADRPLHSGDEVALLPPVSGGAPQPQSQSDAKAANRDHVRIVRAPIAADAVLAQLKRPEDGAAVIFEGVVRNHTRARRTLYLHYEAYESMAQKQMEALATQARAQFDVRAVAIVHRLGHLEIGETSVLIAVASAHRDAAFQACRWLIDTLKKTVPIWKKEYFEDGAVWADGETFPPEIHPHPAPESRDPASK